MVSKIITASTVVLSLSFMPVDRAQADKAGAFAAGAFNWRSCRSRYHQRKST